MFMAALVHDVIMDERAMKHIGVVFGQGGGALIANTRNKAVKVFMDECPEQLEWLWFIDADMKPGWFTLPDMLEAVEPYGPCVASAATYSPLGTGRGLTWAVRGDDGIQRYAETPEENVTELDACGMACTLIHRDVLAGVELMHHDDPWPWFAHDLDENCKWYMGEDYTFCQRARHAGFQVFGVNTPVPHYKLMPI